jgi:curved DNA-binding protein CbpA
MSPERARKILNLRPDDGLEAARAAFRRKVKRLHPDSAGGHHRAAYEEVVEAWRLLESEARPRAPLDVSAEPVQVSANVSWLAVRLGETIEVQAPHRTIRVPLPAHARPGDRLRLRGQGGEPDVIVTLHIAQQTFAETLRRFVDDFRKPGAHA